MQDSPLYFETPSQYQVVNRGSQYHVVLYRMTSWHIFLSNHICQHLGDFIGIIRTSCRVSDTIFILTFYNR